MSYGMYFSEELQKSASYGSAAVGGISSAALAAAVKQLGLRNDLGPVESVALPAAIGALGALQASDAGVGGSMRYLMPASLAAGAAAAGTGKLVGADNDTLRYLFPTAAFGVGGALSAYRLRPSTLSAIIGTGIGTGVGLGAGYLANRNS